MLSSGLIILCQMTPTLVLAFTDRTLHWHEQKSLKNSALSDSQSTIQQGKASSVRPSRIQAVTCAAIWLRRDASITELSATVINVGKQRFQHVHCARTSCKFTFFPPKLKS